MQQIKNRSYNNLLQKISIEAYLNKFSKNEVHHVDVLCQNVSDQMIF